MDIDLFGWLFLAVAFGSIAYLFVKLLMYAMDALIKNDD